MAITTQYKTEDKRGMTLRAAAFEVAGDNKITAIGIYAGTGAPTMSAAKGSIYSRVDGSSTSTRLYVNTDGGTTWTNVTTAA